jgi:Ca2+-binding EF-hand superfamily protein
VDTTYEQALDLDHEQQDRAVHAFHTADINGDGELDLVEFKQLLGTLGMSIPHKQFAAYADAFFADLDTDGSRTLDLEVGLSDLHRQRMHLGLLVNPVDSRSHSKCKLRFCRASPVNLRVRDR